MADKLTNIRAGLKAALDTIDGFRVADNYEPKIVPPCFVVNLPKRILYGLAFGDPSPANTYIIVVSAFLSPKSERAATKQAEALMDEDSALSVKRVIDTADDQPGKAWMTLIVPESNDLGRVTIAGTDYFCTTWEVHVVA